MWQDLFVLNMCYVTVFQRRGHFLGKEDSESSRGAAAPLLHSSPTSHLSDPEDFAGLETSSLLQYADTILHISEDNGTENPLVSGHFNFTHIELGETDIDLDESHV